MTDNYDDIINLPHHTSKRHPRMSMLNRAAQFAPFAALTGFGAAIEESGRLTDEWVELSDVGIYELNKRMAQLIERQAEHPEVSIVYFKPDARKHGGSYKTISGNIKRIDETERMVELTDGKKIPMNAIVEIGTEAQTS